MQNEIEFELKLSLDDNGRFLTRSGKMGSLARSDNV